MIKTAFVLSRSGQEQITSVMFLVAGHIRMSFTNVGNIETNSETLGLNSLRLCNVQGYHSALRSCRCMHPSLVCPIENSIQTHIAPALIQDLTIGGSGYQLTAQRGKVLSAECGFAQAAIVNVARWPTNDQTLCIDEVLEDVVSEV